MYFQDTGACLFSWREPEARKILKEGPFEFRVLETAVEDPLGCLAWEWRKFIEQYRGTPDIKKLKVGQKDPESERQEEQSTYSCAVL